MKSDEVSFFLARFYTRMKNIAVIGALVGGLGVVCGLCVAIFAGSDETIVIGVMIAGPFVIPLIGSSLTLIRVRSLVGWPPYRLAVTGRQEVAWVYFITTQVKVSGAPVGIKRGIAFCSTKGVRVELGLNQRDMDRLKPTLLASFPQATHGWSGEAERRFQTDPASLLLPG